MCHESFQGVGEFEVPPLDLVKYQILGEEKTRIENSMPYQRSTCLTEDNSMISMGHTSPSHRSPIYYVFTRSPTLPLCFARSLRVYGYL